MRRWASLPLLVAVLLALVWHGRTWRADDQQVRQDNHDRLESLLDEAEPLLEQGVEATQLKTVQLAEDIAAAWADPGGDPDEDLAVRRDHAVQAVLTDCLENSRFAFGTILATTQPSLNPEGVVYAPYMRRPDRTIERVDITYDPSIPQDQGGIPTNWFLEPYASDAGVWIEPFQGRASRTQVLGHGLGFELPDGGGRAVVSILWSLDTMHRLLARLDLGELGYPVLFAERSQTLVVHPRADVVGTNARPLDPPFTVDGYDIDAVVDPLTDQDAWKGCALLDGPDWAFCVVAEQVPNHVRADHLQHQIELAVMAALAVALAWIALRPRRPWEASAAFSLGAFGLVAAVWGLVHANPAFTYEPLSAEADNVDRDELLIVTSRSSVREHVELFAERRDTELADVLSVPTGIYLQSLEFSDANDVAITGYIWQRGDHRAGVVLPEAVDGGIVGEDPHYQTPGVTGWYVETTLRQEMEYRRFPFDDKQVWVRFWTRELASEAVLIPDFRSYRELLPYARPGVDDGLVINGWDVAQSYFAYRYHTYGTDFGLNTYAYQANSPELYFAVQLRRSLLDAFVAHVIPLSVVVGLLFLILWRGVLERLSATELVGAGSGLFFVVLLAHIQLRDQLQSPDIVYLETAYLLSYVAILVVALITVFESIRLGHIDENDDLRPHLSRRYVVAQLLYWPTFSTSFAALTLLFLY